MWIYAVILEFQIGPSTFEEFIDQLNEFAGVCHVTFLRPPIPEGLLQDATAKIRTCHSSLINICLGDRLLLKIYHFPSICFSAALVETSKLKFRCTSQAWKLSEYPSGTAPNQPNIEATSTSTEASDRCLDWRKVSNDPQPINEQLARSAEPTAAHGRLEMQNGVHVLQGHQDDAFIIICHSNI